MVAIVDLDQILKCGHKLSEHLKMMEARESSEIEGAKSDKTDCELIELSKKN